MEIPSPLLSRIQLSLRRYFRLHQEWRWKQSFSTTGMHEMMSLVDGPVLCVVSGPSYLLVQKQPCYHAAVGLSADVCLSSRAQNFELNLPAHHLSQSATSVEKAKRVLHEIHRDVGSFILIHSLAQE